MDIFKIVGTVAIKGVEEAKKDLKDTSEEAIDLADGFGKAIDKAVDFSLKVAAATSAAVTAIGGLALASSNSMEESFDSFVSATDVSSEALSDYEEVLKSIYKKNYGESFDDIAKAMATVKQQAGDISADELEAMTIDALILKDTFDMEVNESMRAAKMLMKQFGISGKQAYNLIAQGAKNGLNKNDDLLDSINEYSVHYKQLGLDAEDFFNSLMNGTEAGTFSVDKLGDAMKEFGIRVKDGSDTSREAFVTLGYDADEMFQIFNEGGESAATATQAIIDKLAAMPDGVEKTTAGVALFGTMWEDLGVEGIKALGDLEGGIDSTKEALESINETKYDNLKSKFEGVKRKLETTMITPLGKKLQPLAEKFIKMIEKKTPSIQKLVEKLGDKIVDIADDSEPIIECVIDDALPTLIDILGFVIENFDKLTIGIGATVAAFKTMQIISVVTTAIQGATSAMGALNAIMSANPIGLIVSAVGGLAVALGGVSMAMQEEEVQIDKTTAKILEERKAREEKIQSIEDEKKAIEEKAVAELVEIQNTEDLWKELQTLCDESGNVKEADKSRADFILNELNNALGTEYTMTGNQIDNYKDLRQEINNVIQAKRAEILLTAQEERYKNALNAVSAEENQLAQDAIAIADQKDVIAGKELMYTATMQAYQKKMAEYRKAAYNQDKAAISIKFEADAILKKAEALKEQIEIEKEALESKEEFYEQQKETLKEYYSDIAMYEEASTLLLEGNTEAAIELLDSLGTSFQKASDLVGQTAEQQKEILGQQLIEAEVIVREIEKLLENASEEEIAIYERQLKKAQEYAENAKEQYYIAGGDIVKEYSAGAEDATYILGDTIESAIDEITSKSYDKIPEFEKIGQEMIAGISVGIKKEEGESLKTLSTVMYGYVNQAKFDLDINSPSKRFEDEVGVYIPSGVGKGIKKNEEAALEPMRNIYGQMINNGLYPVIEDVSTVGVSGSGFDSTSILNKLDQLIYAITHQKLYMNGDVVVAELMPAIDSELGNIYAMAERGQ